MHIKMCRCFCRCLCWALSLYILYGQRWKKNYLTLCMLCDAEFTLSELMHIQLEWLWKKIDIRVKNVNSFVIASTFCCRLSMCIICVAEFFRRNISMVWSWKKNILCDISICMNNTEISHWKNNIFIILCLYCLFKLNYG